ncbi:envelope stress response membrane protein PspB [Amphiplicatus metriothermophilus]|uniref:Phage shock protein B n=1 Tax=Amphiplicatus metriothermophilus TaxID=1519374 RepID=A0A239Q1C3_9PROT|nr:envelope stress response membrane protein PspB [Amphiplicatus metriothermophilus]MBB5520026.1 phage shock protein B [Amphiplicatus metriothermophilus]SNT76036.1 phage shock protein B [Amphiplicatus metriothermophilus]
MEGPFIVAVVAIVFVALPATIMHYVTEWRKTKTFSADDERLIDDLWKTAQRLERRVDALETILDKEAPSWRDEYRERPHV